MKSYIQYKIQKKERKENEKFCIHFDDVCVCKTKFATSISMGEKKMIKLIEEEAE